MQIFSQNGPWSVPNKQNPSFYSIFHAFPRPKFPPVWPFPRENPFRWLLGINHPYRKISRLNTANIDLTFAPPNPHWPRPTWHPHRTNTGPTWIHVGSMLGPTWVHVGSIWVQHGYQRDHCGPGSPRDHCGPGPQPNPKWNFFRGLYPWKMTFKKF